MFDIGKFFYRARCGLTSETEVKYSQAANASEKAHEAAKTAEKMDKIKVKAKANSLVSKICTKFEADLDDLLS